ncbi:hypothetical protein I316_06268 [Kwoniella heveanensis BCC8398]|uniref:Uncharacterized protein n=1 Tax=Kwoniella heveanensis BCC8398 TaxID=1296120 RepID=A0A1B9GM68_9TREE|nr:hypothetical protein I316_06268 [Kwoniella heveanensis BCC8398]
MSIRNYVRNLGKEIELRKVMNYEGTGYRLGRFLAKARQGNGFTVGALGGSVSIGHGLKRGMGYHESAYSELNMHRVVFDHLDALFPAKNGRQIGREGTKRGANTFVNGAVPAIGSDYFAMCFGHHIPEQVDLVLVDMGERSSLERGAESYEMLLRHLLALPNKPAVINLQVFALMFQTIATGGDIHQGISSYYDVPTVSLRNLLLPIILQNSSYGITYFDHPAGTTELDVEGFSTRHISAKGHVLIGRLANAFIDMRIIDLDRGLYGADLESKPVPELPRIRALQRFNADEVIPAIPPKCLSAHSRSPTLIPSTNSGWYKYLIADEPGSIVSFDFATAGGLVQLSVYRSHNAGLGTAACWVDDMEDKRVVIEARWDDLVSVGYTVTIADDLEDGDHVLTCELLEETKDPQLKHEFRIIAVIR